MPVPNIQNNKYIPQPLPEITAPRSELLAHFSRSAEKKLIFASAPGGSGKTVSTLLWLKQINRKPVWLGLDAYDNAVSIFYKLFCTGILSVQPDNSRMIEILQNPSFYDAPVEHTIMLLSEFNAEENEFVLVLDDFHTITNSEILESLPFILRRLPHSFTVLILSRSEPDKYFSEYMESMHVSVIGNDALSFTAEEVYAFFSAHGKDITAEEAETVFSFTGGWVIAVSFLVQNASPAPEGFGKNILNPYIKENIWEQWDKNTQAFLLATAVIDEMPVTLCEKITGITGAGALFETLRAQNVFITYGEDGVYRYHRLFLDFLRGLPAYSETDKKKTWRTAAEYYANQGEIITASQYACKSGDIKTILDTLYKYMTVSDIPVHETVFRLKDSLFNADFEKLCEECPVLYEPLVYMSFSTGDVLRFEKYINKLKQNLPLIINEYPKFTEPAFIFMLLDSQVLLGAHFTRLNEFPPAVFQNREIRRSTYSFQLPFLHRANRDFYELTDKKTIAEWLKSSKKMFKSQYEPIIHCINAGLLLEQNHLAEALTETQTAYNKLTSSTTKEICFSVRMHLAAVCFALNKRKEFAGLLEGIEIFINEKAEFLRPNFLAFKARVKLWNGEASAAHEWLEHDSINESKPIEPYKFYQHFTVIRAYTVLGEFEKAKSLAVRVRKTALDFRRPQDAAEAGVLLSAVLWAENKKEEALDIMETVLSEMQPYSFIRLIADEGATVLQVLKKISGKAERKNNAGVLNAAYVNSVYIAAYAVSKQRRGLMAELKTKPVKLSRQQKMVIRFLAQGYKRERIIEKTGLSPNTVKSYINIAYRKLEVGNAADAVVKARELGIIE